MSETLSQIEHAMRGDAETLRIIGQNIANAEVTAYRRQIAVAHVPFQQAVDELAPTLLDQRAELHIVNDLEPGTLKPSSEGLDVAIEGDGFFMLQGTDNVLLTRRGDFHRSAEGTLVASSGQAVLGTQGTIQLDSAAVDIDAQGVVRAGDAVLGQLKLVRVSDVSQLSSLGNGLFTLATNNAAIEDGSVRVRQHFLEGANVNSTGEMVQLMETLRHFEAAQRFVRGYDQMMEKAISELGKVE
jgi:flagellar basal-body rod protein FlgG